MTFRLTTLLYLFALLASSMAVWGIWGLVVLAFSLLLLVLLQGDSHGLRTRGEQIMVFLPIVALPLLFLAMKATECYPREVTDRWESVNNLKQLSLAALNYEHARSSLPPLYLADSEGKPLLSWRALILHFIEGDTVHQALRFDKPWDSPTNQKQLQTLDFFSSPLAEETIPGETHYVAIVDESTIWSPTQTVTLRDVADPRSRTLLFIEIPSRGIRWSEPRDLTLDEAVALLCNDAGVTHSDDGYFVSRRYGGPWSGLRVAFADGSVRQLPVIKDRADARALCTRSGGESLEHLDHYFGDEPYREPLETIVHWNRITNVLLWLAICVYPFTRWAKIFPSPYDDPCLDD